jgi:hypothetical protein
MKTTGFNPQIVTKNAEPVIQLFEELGFEKRHTKEGEGGPGIPEIKSVRLKDANGFYLDVAQADAGQAQDMVTIRLNVDNFQEAFDVLLSHGFVNEFGDRVAKTGSSISTAMSSPTGFKITLIQHIKNNN